VRTGEKGRKTTFRLSMSIDDEAFNQDKRGSPLVGVCFRFPEVEFAVPII
jgi:hypothetical protein